MSTKDPMAAVRQYIDAFNKGDAKVMAATFADTRINPRRHGTTRLARANSHSRLVSRRVD